MQYFLSYRSFLRIIFRDILSFRNFMFHILFGVQHLLSRSKRFIIVALGVSWRCSVNVPIITREAILRMFLELLPGMRA